MYEFILAISAIIIAILLFAAFKIFIKPSQTPKPKPKPLPETEKCQIPYNQRVNVPGCSSDCTVKDKCLKYAGEPCFEKPPAKNQTDSDGKNVPWCYIRNGKKCQPQTFNTPVSLFEKTKTCVVSQAGGIAKCSDMKPLTPLPAIKFNKLVTNGKTPFKTQTSDVYKQFWTTIDGGLDNMPTKGKVPKNNKRAIAVTVPNTKQPADGWPYVLSWQFMKTNGYGTAWNNRLVIGGIAEIQIGKNNTSMDLDDDYGSGLSSYMLMLKHIVASGFVLVNISELLPDTEFWSECTSNDVNDACWNDGKNPDADALRVLFEKIHKNNLIPDINLNYNQMAVLGYSTGAQQVSRMINNFPFMKTSSGVLFPKISLGVMIAGGSYWCYNYNDVIPKNYYPCADKGVGCCPNNKTEDNYDTGKLKNHPPVLLLQGEQDVWAAWEASYNYFNILSARGDPVYRVMGPVTNPDHNRGRHGVYGCQIPAIIALLHLYV